MPEKTPVPPALGRRERKRLNTRNGLATVALDLFAERGFDAVTVTDIAEQADVDPSTFFRHFGSKEAVIFAMYDDWAGQIGDTIRAQPPDLPLLETLRVSVKDLAEMVMIDLDSERRRVALMEATPSVQAYGLAVREALIEEIAVAIAGRMGVDPALDGRPYLLAATYIMAANWHRRRVVQTGDLVNSVDEAVDSVNDIVRGFVAVFAD